MFKFKKKAVTDTQNMEKTTGAALKKQPKPKKRVVKAVIFIAIILLIIIAAFSMFGKGGGDAGMPQFSAGMAEVADIQNTVTVKGTVVGSDSADVYSSANLTISQILVKEGDYVTKDQTLALLDTSDIMDQYNIQRVAYSDAKKAYENAKTLYAGGGISKSEYDEAESAYKTAALNLSAANVSEKGVVKSPISGTVTRVNCTVGRIAGDTNAKDAMFVIENVEKLKMEVKISESEIADIRVGQEVEISAEILGKDKVSGVVSQIAPTGESKAEGNGMVIPVTIDVDKGDTNLIAGVTAKAVIKTSSRKDVLTVPVDSIYEDPDTEETSVFVVNKDNVVKKVPVTIGLEGDFVVEVAAGDLKEGDRVILAPDFTLEDGSTVAISE